MKKFHMCQSVRGFLARNRQEMKRALKYTTKDDGTPFRDVDELRNAFMDELAQGHEVVPLGECDNFDYKKGCMGHDQVPAGKEA